MTTDPVHDAAVHEKNLTEVTEHWYRTFDSLKERAIEEAQAGHTRKLVEAVEANPVMIANLLTHHLQPSLPNCGRRITLRGTYEVEQRKTAPCRVVVG